ncbi:MAG: M15 family metallopeptidase [Bacillota bacterium]|nr:M15 family metallopeptidase [Bacillota bacterium]
MANKHLENKNIALKERKKILRAKKIRLISAFIFIAVALIIININKVDLNSSLSNKLGFHKGQAINHSKNEINPKEINPKEKVDWRLILVNSSTYIPSNFHVKLKELSGGYSVDERIYPELQQMFDDARNAGVYPVIVSAFRTAEKQKSLLLEKIKSFKAQGLTGKEAEEAAKTWVATPGTSEHQLGLAVDINTDVKKSTNDAVFKWLKNNSYKYGFIQRYPPEKSHITGVNYEPWHFRYVGKEAAREIYEQNICLEEYLR